MPRFSILQLGLLTALVGIVLAGYRTYFHEKDFVARKVGEFSADGQRLLFHANDGLEVWDVSRSRPSVKRLDNSHLLGPPNTFELWDFYPLAGNLLAVDRTGSGLHELALINTDTGEVQRRFALPGQLMALGPTGEFYACQGFNPNAPSQDFLEVIRSGDGKVIARAAAPASEDRMHPRSVRMSLDGRTLMWFTREGALFKASADQGDDVVDLRVEKLAPLACRKHPNPRGGTPASLIALKSGRVAWWNFCRQELVVLEADGSECFVQRLLDPDDLATVERDYPWLFRISDDGRRLLCYDQTAYLVIDLDSRQTLYRHEAHLAEVARDIHIDMSPDGKTLAIISRDRVSLWDLDAGKETKVLAESNRWRNFSVYWLALVIWAAVYGWESKRRSTADPSSPLSAWSSLVQILAAIALLAGLATLLVRTLPASLTISFWPYYLLVAVNATVYLLVEVRGWWLRRRQQAIGAKRESTIAQPEALQETQPLLHWQWRLMIFGGVAKVGLALALFTHCTSQTPYFLHLFRSHMVLLQLWDLDAYVPLVGLLCALAGWTGVRLISAGVAQSQGPALATLRRHQFWGWLHGDIVNSLLAIVEWMLNRK